MKTYAGSEVLIKHKIQAFFYAYIALFTGIILYIGLSLLLRFPDTGTLVILAKSLVALFCSFLFFSRGKYQTALIISYVSLIASLSQIVVREMPLSEQTVFFMSLIQSVGILYLILLAQKKSQIFLGGLISLGATLFFYLIRVKPVLAAQGGGNYANLAGALIILLFEILIGFLIHRLLDSTLSRIQYEQDYHAPTGLPNRHNMLNTLQKMEEPANTLDLVFYRIENLNELRLRLGEQRTMDLVKAAALFIEKEHRATSYMVTGETLGLIFRDPQTPPEAGIDSILDGLKTPLALKEMAVQVFLRACQTKTMTLPENRFALIEQGLMGLNKAAIDNKRKILFTGEEEEQVRKSMNLIHRLSSSIEKGACHPVYQAITDMRGSRTAFEVLTRWNLEDGTEVGPEEFIPFLEQSGLMADFFFQMLDKVLDDMKRHPRFFGESRVFLNLSPELINYGFDFDRMMKTIDRYDVNKQCLGFEITESTLLKDRQKGILLIEKLKEQGFRIALDDFGTGYSNMVQILSLPFHKVKFDKSFIKGILKEPQKRDLCAILIDHFHKYGYVTVAEGVETEEQYEFLKTLGCDHYQGYLFAKPIRPIAAPDDQSA
ncbi:MAG: EAL domain-containing protein [Spirochaetales bacterium]|nr:EAL domain-containing protein [Spirochaetales bacterium]